MSIQVYDPPYLFKGPRPVIAKVPAQVVYGSTMHLDASGGPPVASVMMMRPCAVTHSVDMDQRAVLLAMTGGAGTLSVTFPTDHSLAPPGYYMLFFVSAAGVPSVATFVNLVDATPTFSPLYLGTYSGDALIEEVFDGDLTLERIAQGCKVTLESRHGSITINHKIDQHPYANLKAHTTVHIGEKIDQGSIAQILAGGDVTIGQSIDAGAQASITSTLGKIALGQKVDATSSATLIAGTTVQIGQTIDQHSNVIIVAQGDVAIGEKIDEHATADITSVHGSITIGQKVDKWAIATLTAGTTVHIGQKIDQHSNVTIVAQGDVTIDEKLDQHTTSTITSVHGSITVVQGMSGGAVATLKALGGSITMDTVDAGCTLNWSAQSFNCPHQNGTINHV